MFEIVEFSPRFEMCDFFAIAGPRPGAEAIYAAAMITDLEDLREDFSDRVLHHPLTDGSGLVPWGNSTSGDTYYWKFEHTKATTVVTGSRDDAFWEFPGTLTSQGTSSSRDPSLGSRPLVWCSRSVSGGVG
ncbi:hypothetical protein [Streptacidiphilus sp. EB103A]|uniref:hypothetical protein n=1 Tax=Streptacidiphilus sp. EB103A TaxID=3156275 RepID=UPI003511AEE8